MSETEADKLAERYVAAVDAFNERVRSVPVELLEFREGPETWSVRDIVLHVADVDQLLGMRLRQILGAEKHPAQHDYQQGIKMLQWTPE